jgi:hypothetical protein
MSTKQLWTFDIKTRGNVYKATLKQRSCSSMTFVSKYKRLVLFHQRVTSKYKRLVLFHQRVTSKYKRLVLFHQRVTSKSWNKIPINKHSLFDDLTSLCDVHVHYIRYLHVRFYDHHWVDTSAGGLLVLEGIITASSQWLGIVCFIISRF